MARSLYGLADELHGVTKLHVDADESGKKQDVYDVSDEMLARRTEELTDVQLFAQGARIGRQVTESARLLMYLAFERDSREAETLGMSVVDFLEMEKKTKKAAEKKMVQDSVEVPADVAVVSVETVVA